MKKVLLVLAFLVNIVANAQSYITNLDDIALLGTWKVNGQAGDFNFDYDYVGKEIKEIHFCDGNYTKIVFADGTDYLDWIFKGYCLNYSQTGRYFLHLFPWNSATSIVNFEVTEFDNGVLRLSTYDKKGWIILEKSDADGIKNISASMAPTGTKTYNINGVEVGKNAKGIIISKGKKQLK